MDTHVVIWVLSDESRLSQSAKAAIDEARQRGSGLAVCAITLLEMTILTLKRRLELNISLEALLREVEKNFVVLPITGRACVRSLSLPEGYPKDPADRIIAATALVEGLSLLTADREIRRSKAVPTIW